MKIINKILNYLIVAMLLFFVAENIISNQSSTVKVQSSAEPKYNLTLTIDDAKKNFPEADSLALEDVNLYNVFDDGNKIGTIVNTSPLSDEIYGYNSITPLTIFLDENDRISEVEICENRETRGYLNKVINSGYLDLWDGLTPKEASTYNVDAVSGCTFTSIAVAQSLQIRMQDLSKEKGKIAIDSKLLARQICIVLVTILSAICFFNPNKTKILRYVTLLLSIAILGFWTNSLLSLALFYNWMTNGISLVIQLPLLIIALLAILLPLFTKKSFYCQYLCPFGAAQEFVGVIGQKVKGKKSSALSPQLSVLSSQSMKSIIFNFFAVLRKVILLTLLIIVALGVGLDLSVVEPFPIFNYQSIGFGVAIFAAVIIVASVFIKKPWCNYLCPTGTLLESIRKLRN